MTKLFVKMAFYVIHFKKSELSVPILWVTIEIVGGVGKGDDKYRPLV